MIRMSPIFRNRLAILLLLLVLTANQASGAEFEFGDSGNRNDITMNPMPSSVLLDPDYFSVSEINHIIKSTAEDTATILYHGAGDTDLDGDPEIIISGWTFRGGNPLDVPPDAELYMFEAEADQTNFISVESALGISSTAGTGFIRINDFTGDSLPDVLMLGHNEVPPEPTENVLLANAGSGFSGTVFGPKMTAHEGNTGDFNDDGYLDFIASAYQLDLSFADDPLANEPNTGSVMLCLNDQSGSFGCWALRFDRAVEGIEIGDPQLDGIAWIESGSASAFGNLDADPEPEVVVVDSYNSPETPGDSESWLIDNIQFEQTHIWGDIQQLPLPYLEANEHFDGHPCILCDGSGRHSHDIQVEIFDYDSDGDNDVLISSMIWVEDGRDAAGVIQFLNNDGLGNFTDVTEEVLFNYNLGNAGSHDPRLLDINRDGFLDIVMVETSSYAEGVEHVWGADGDFWTGERQESIINTWANEILINTGAGKFVSTFWNGFHELTLRQEQLFESYAPEFQPYNLTDNLYFPYMLDDGRIGFVTDNEAYPNVRFFFDVRSDGPIYTGPEGRETASLGAPGYSEYFYLTENADVRSLVEGGNYPDGLSHFLDVGLNEGRSSFAPGTHVHGYDGNDQIILREGNERAVGYAGDDFIDGKEGFDSAVYELARTEYEISADNDQYTVTALSGTEGQDVLVNVESGIFGDQNITFAGDDDLDGVPNWQDVFPYDFGLSGDTDGDGQDNNVDTDDDNDGIPDGEDSRPLDSAYLGTASGAATLTHEWAQVTAGSRFENPVVIVGPPTFHGGHQGVVRVRNVSDNSFEAKFEVRFQEWDYLDGWHTSEDIPHIVLEAGRWQRLDGSIWEVGTFGLDGTGTFKSVSFGEALPGKPSLFLTLQTSNGGQAVVPRARNVSASGFEATLYEQQSLMDGHVLETVGYLAVWSPLGDGVVNVGGTEFPYLLQDATVDHRFVPVMSSALKMEEEQSLDSEVAHTNETVAVMGLGSKLFAQDVTTKGTDAAALRRLAPEYAAPMEWGVVDGVTATWKLVPLSKTYTDPVIVAQVSARKGDRGILRIRNAMPDSFEVRFQEWDYLDGVHDTPERIFYLVAERGTSTVAGLQVQAGYEDTSMMAASGLQDVSFGTTFTQTPAIFGSVMSYFGPQAATLRFNNVDPSGFSIGMQEQESIAQTHVVERLGWIAIEPGVGSTTDGRRVEVGRITASSTAATYLFDRKTTRRFPPLISSLSSYRGSDTAWASQRGLTDSQVQVFVSEEQSRDSEVAHTTETISVFVAE